MSTLTPHADGRVRIPDFTIFRRVRTGEWRAVVERECEYCGWAYGYNVPIYRDPLFDGELTGHLSCAIEHDDVRMWTPTDFAAPWPANINININININTGTGTDAGTSANEDEDADIELAFSAAERLLRAIAAGEGPVKVPCAHLLAFAEFYCNSPVVIMLDSAPIGCCMCDVALSAGELSALIVRTVRG